MSPTQTAFYQSISEMKQSYLADLQMVANYQKVVEAETGHIISEHMLLLQNQLSLLIETIDQLLAFR
jgi:hypothetical protein